MDRTRIFKISKLKVLTVFVASAIFVAWGVLSGVGRDPLFGWLTILLFGASALICAALLVSDRASLRLDEEGFEVIGPFRRNRSHWKDIESIRIAKIPGGASVIALDYKSGDSNCKIVNVYNVSLKELCATLKEWHELYGNST